MRFIFNAAKNNNIASCAHYIVPKANKSIPPPEDYAFLQAKGAFNLESDDLRNELIALYFDHVHPILPVIEPYEFLHKFELEGPSHISALLLQSMFLVASSVRGTTLLLHVPFRLGRCLVYILGRSESIRSPFYNLPQKAVPFTCKSERPHCLR